MKKLTTIVTLCLCLAAWAQEIPEEQEGATPVDVDTVLKPAPVERLTLHEDGNRTRPVHLINLYDEDGEEISPHDLNPKPFSTRLTCGRCHDYEKICSGWHFNSHAKGPSGRRGEPWFLVDEKSGTQLPVTFRDWAGARKPEEASLTYWGLTREFTRHAPGGDFAEVYDAPLHPEARWDVSGYVEVNCLACHNAKLDQDQSEWVKQIARQNYRWAATAASGLAFVDGVASRLPDSFDRVLGGNPDNQWAAPPDVAYDETRFDTKNRVFFDITAEAPANRCYFCHTTWQVEEEDGHESFGKDRDVHMTAGMTCTSCHRNGLDHQIVRGYEGEFEHGANTTLTCRGCHLGSEAADGPARFGGRFMAPRPEHKGLPENHIEDMTCTSCHAGAWPEAKTGTVRTSRANRLGVHGRAQWYTDAPHIASPVYAKNPDGRIGLSNAMWPAYWAVVDGDKATPISIDIIRETVDSMHYAEALAAWEAEQAAAKAAEEGEAAEEPAEAEAATEEPAEEPDARLTEAQIVKLLNMLKEDPRVEGAPAYICNGHSYTLAGEGKLACAQHPDAAPYAWPVAHDVRPAAQSLGAGGCTDCHTEDAPFFFAAVSPGSPVQLDAPKTTVMHEFQGYDPELLDALSNVAEYRDLLVKGGVVILILLGLLLVRYALMGIEAGLRALVATGSRK